MGITVPKILIVEDDNSLRTLYELKFELSDYIVQSANNGHEGLKAAREFMPDLILLDLRMPVMSGDEMLARLRETEWGADMRVIILTNISRNEAPHALRFLSVDRYVVKVHTTPQQIVDIAGEVLH